MLITNFLIADLRIAHVQDSRALKLQQSTTNLDSMEPYIAVY